MMIKPNFQLGLFCLMANSKLSVHWLIFGVTNFPWRTQKVLETDSRKNINPPNGEAYSKPTMRRLCRTGMKEWR